MLSKLYGYLAAAAAFMVAVGLAVLKGMSIQKHKTELAQKDIEMDSLKAVHEAKDKVKILSTCKKGMICVVPHSIIKKLHDIIQSKASCTEQYKAGASKFR